MTPAERAEARERCAAATEAPWHANSETDDGKTGLGCDIGGNIREKYGRTSGDFVARTWGWGPTVANADFIAHARTDLPRALDALDAAEATLARVRALLGQWERELRDYPDSDPQAVAARTAIKLCGVELASALDATEQP